MKYILILIILIILLVLLFNYFYVKKYYYDKNESEEKCIYLSSRGILKSCDIISIDPKSSIKKLENYENIDYRLKNIPHNNNTTIYVCSSALKDFSQKYLPLINEKFILVSGDCDETIPYDIFNKEEFNSFINSDKIIHWFSQNCIITHPKITGIPIGLDYHTMSNKDHEWGKHKSPLKQEEILININRKPFYDRIIKAYSNFHFTVSSSKYGYDRKDAIKRVSKDLVYYEPSKVTRIESWNKQVQYAFVLSPHGNGLDCHRTWEALVLGCIPIVKTSKIDYLYDDLPVLIVKCWSDISEDLLKNTILLFKNKTFNYNKLTLKYWTDIIRQ